MVLHRLAYTSMRNLSSYAQPYTGLVMNHCPWADAQDSANDAGHSICAYDYKAIASILILSNWFLCQRKSIPGCLAAGTAVPGALHARRRSRHSSSAW